MKQLFNPDSFIMIALTRVGDLIILSVLWLVCSLPLVTMGAATTALNYAVQELVHNRDNQTVRAFFRSFRRDFWQSTLLFLILAIGAVLIGSQVFLFLTGRIPVSGFLAWASLLPLTLWGFVASYAFPLEARFSNTILGTLKNSLFLCLGNLPLSVALLCLNLMPLVVLMTDSKVFLAASMFWIFLGSGGICFLNTLLLKKLLLSLEGIDPKSPAENS